jgi:hypothetical protein
MQLSHPNLLNYNQIENGGMLLNYNTQQTATQVAILSGGG